MENAYLYKWIYTGFVDVTKASALEGATPGVENHDYAIIHSVKQ